MRFSASILAGAAVAALGLAPLTATAATTLQNGGFDHNLDGWTADPFHVVVTNIFVHRDGEGVVVRGDEGDPAAVYTKPGFPDDVFAVMYGNEKFADPDTGLVTLTQTFHTDGGLLRGMAAFLSGDYLPYDDFAYVQITPVGGAPITLFSSHVGAFPAGYGATPWTSFSQLLTAGDYTLQAAIANVDDDLQSSNLLLDDFRITAVPEPATWATMLTGFFGLGAMLRRRRLAQAKIRRRP